MTDTASLPPELRRVSTTKTSGIISLRMGCSYRSHKTADTSGLIENAAFVSTSRMHGFVAVRLVPTTTTGEAVGTTGGDL